MKKRTKIPKPSKKIKKKKKISGKKIKISIYTTGKLPPVPSHSNNLALRKIP